MKLEKVTTWRPPDVAPVEADNTWMYQISTKSNNHQLSYFGDLANCPAMGYFGSRWAFVSVLAKLVLRMRRKCYFRGFGKNSEIVIWFSDPVFLKQSWVGLSDCSEQIVRALWTGLNMFFFAGILISQSAQWTQTYYERAKRTFLTIESVMWHWDKK